MSTPSIARPNGVAVYSPRSWELWRMGLIARQSRSETRWIVERINEIRTARRESISTLSGHRHPLEQQLAREQRAVQLTVGEDEVGDS
jgi:hypothetical protein